MDDTVNPQEFKRRLTAILSADVEGYSRLMREDEQATVRTLTTYRTAITHLIEQYRGRVVDSPGDNILAEFSSVVDAVNCGVEIHRELAERNAELPENRRMRFRIGINLGDVLEDGRRIYGDGVNIAARMEGLAEAGGIAISGTVHDAIESKIGLEYEYLGEQQVKNINKPVRAYRVLSYPGAAAHRVIKAKRAAGTRWRNIVAGIAAIVVVGVGFAIWNFYFRPPTFQPASKEKMAFQIPDKPSIAVLPFVNMSEDSKQEYFNDGITDQIIAGLSRIEKMFVIARNSTFTYKGKPVKVQQVAEELGVRYVLEGSVQKSGDRIRITTQLIDALKGDHVWSERYDRSMKDVFALQDEITIKVVEALRVKLSATDIKRSSGKGTQNLEAFLKFAQGFDSFIHFTPDANTQAAQYFQEAIDLDPNYAAPYAFMSQIHLLSLWFGVSKSPKESMEAAIKFAEKARELDESYPLLYTALGEIERLKGQFDKAINYYEQGLALDPNNIGLISMLGFATLGDGRAEEAILHFRKAIRLNPLDPTLALWGLGAVYCRTGRYEEAIPPLKQAIHNRPQMFGAHLDLAACYAGLGKEEEASAAAAEVLRINPKFTVEGFAKVIPQKNKAIRERYLENLRNSGLPDKPPLPLPDKPSIAVLPFVNMSDDPKQEFFSDGMTEEIITALSKSPYLFVIARQSTFTYKGKPVKVKQVSEELGVRYVLEGSVRRAGEKVRVTAQFIDAMTGYHLWAERFDRELKNIFALQDEITLKIMKSVHEKLELVPTRRSGRGARNVESFLKAKEGRELLFHSTQEDNILARKLFEEAIALDPNNATAYTLLAWTYMADSLFGKSPKESRKRAIELAERAVAVDELDAAAHASLGCFLAYARQYEKAIVHAEQAMTLDPNSSDVLFNSGLALAFSGRPDEAIPLLQKAIRLNPFAPSIYFFTLSLAYRMANRFDEAVEQAKRAVERNPKDLFANLSLAAGCILTGRETEARAAAAEVLKIDATFSVEQFGSTLPYKDKSFVDRSIDAWRKAGLK